MRPCRVAHADAHLRTSGVSDGDAGRAGRFLALGDGDRDHDRRADVDRSTGHANCNRIADAPAAYADGHTSAANGHTSAANGHTPAANGHTRSTDP